MIEGIRVEIDCLEYPQIAVKKQNIPLFFDFSIVKIREATNNFETELSWDTINRLPHSSLAQPRSVSALARTATGLVFGVWAKAAHQPARAAARAAVESNQNNQNKTRLIQVTWKDYWFMKRQMHEFDSISGDSNSKDKGTPKIQLR